MTAHGVAERLGGQSVLKRVVESDFDLVEAMIINPAHPRAAEVRIVSERPFSYDPRLLGR